MPAKNKYIANFDNVILDKNCHNVGSERHLFHRKQAERKYLLKRRIEEIREEKELREQDFF